MNQLDKILKTLSQAPSEHLAPDIAKRIGELISGNNELVADLLNDIIDECNRGKFASDFAKDIIEHTIQTARIKD